MRAVALLREPGPQLRSGLEGRVAASGALTGADRTASLDGEQREANRTKKSCGLESRGGISADKTFRVGGWDGKILNAATAFLNLADVLVELQEREAGRRQAARGCARGTTGKRSGKPLGGTRMR